MQTAQEIQNEMTNKYMLTITTHMPAYGAWTLSEAYKAPMRIMKKDMAKPPQIMEVR